MADEDLKELLKRNLEVSEKSLVILKKMRRAQQIGRALKIAYWLVIIAGVLGAYYYLKPVVGSYIDTFNQMKSDFFSITNKPR